MRVKKYNPANLSCLLLMKTLKASMKWSSFKKPTAICYQATGIKRKKKLILRKMKTIAFGLSCILANWMS